MLTEAGIAVLGAGAGQLIRYVIHQYKTKKRNVNEWYEDVILSISYGRGVCDLGRERTNLNYGNIAEEAEKVAHRLRKHSNPPSEVDETSVLLVQNLETMFRKLSAATEASDDQSTMDAINELFEMGQRDLARNKELDMGEAVNESTEYSSTMANIFSQVDADPEGFGAQLGEHFGNAESFHELLEKVHSQHGVSERSIDRMLDGQFLTEEWDESLSVGIRILLQMTSNQCVEAINHVGEINGNSI